ncbi:CocE/NonD family hydrolase [Dyella terrae]|uniref:CocE/NonD family hydrolase n=1 Tax=Dyella terrae TaxID=522259 RepID=UPI001EFD468A|nr:CocE/NonD family hydrolase [Dyella terrae]ULU26222.1 CocE/NonD family hydrolase [Dyella terrae]
MSLRVAAFVSALLLATPVIADGPAGGGTAPLDFQWSVKIPLRDGVKLNATLYRPEGQRAPLPCIFTLTPYIAQSYHPRGVYFATHDYVFLTVDVRGRGNSEGEFTPLLQEAKDGYDVVEWLAKQPYCNGKVTMWGGSYAGYDQWATAKEFPPHLATIIPVAAVRPGVDFPFVNNIYYAYDMQWLTLTSGHTGQEVTFGDWSFWAMQFGKLYKAQRPFRELDTVVGNPSPVFQTWLDHPEPDAYWDSYSATPAQFAKIDLPILTITGQYDDDQYGALSYYRDHLRAASAQAAARHYLLIGPWDHAGTRTPTETYAGIKFGAASMVDVNALDKDWYDWTLKGGSKPAFLKDRVTYYMLLGDEGEWRYAPSLDAITTGSASMYLTSDNGHNRGIYESGALTSTAPRDASKPDGYIYDPRDTTFNAWDGAEDAGASLTDQSGLLGANGKILVYHTAPFTQDTEFAGFPKLSLWLSIDQPDTDLAAFLYEIRPDGSSVQLGSQFLRARYRKSQRTPELVKPGAVERYDVDHFAFIARRIAKGSRLRLAIGPLNTRFFEKNYNSGGVVANESGKDARTVTVTLYHDAQHPSVLVMPLTKKP